jgi:ribosomal protein S18 acetylase RimI-like enzyme
MIAIKKAFTTDLDTLVSFSRKTFFDAFFHLNNPEDMEAYASVAFNPDKLFAELNNPDSAFYFALLNDELVGYIKLNYASAQTEFKDKSAVEVERIYVLASAQGKQIGKQLIDFAEELAVKDNLQYIWLGVWDKNYNAIRFYERSGFKTFSTHDFFLGNDHQTDLLMRKEL